MNRLQKPAAALILLLAAAFVSRAQTEPPQNGVWTLDMCLDYALENNIQLREQKNTYESSLQDSYAAKFAFFPSASAGVSQGITKYASGDASGVYTGSYNLSADMTLYNGGKLRNSYRQALTENTIDSLYVAESANDIRISIIEAYMQCLYARESITVNESNLESSKAQMERGEQLWKVGTLSKVDYAQLQSQYQSDEYQLVSAKNSYASGKLTLKQLLELDIMDEIEISDIDADDSAILELIPGKEEVYANAKAYLPEILRSQAQIKSAEYGIDIAKAGYLPSLSLSAGAGTANNSNSTAAFGSQIADSFNVNAGLTLRIPIFSQMQNKTSVRKAQIQYDNSRLQAASVEKDVLKKVETAYLNVISAQSQYVSAKQQLDYARKSYELVSEQFTVGSKNTVELITAQNEYISARQSVVLAKYTTLMNKDILDVYQGKY